jgi:hypothetical protein
LARAATLLSAACGTRINAETVRRLTEAAGDAWWHLDLALATDLETTAHTPFAAPVVVSNAQPLPRAPPAILELDGAMVPLVRGEGAEARTLVIGSQESDTTTALRYVSQIAPAATFARTILPELQRRCLDAHPGPVVALSDGAVWIEDLLDPPCPQAVRVLDIMHAAGYLARAAQASVGPGTARSREWFATTRAALRRGDATATLDLLAALPASPERDTAVRYLDQRRPMLAYDRCNAAGWPVGSGAVESTNKQIVEARLKGAGMHWTRQHANAVLALTALEASGQWATWWPRTVLQLRTAHADRAAARRTARTPMAPAAAPLSTMLTVASSPPSHNHRGWRTDCRSSLAPVRTASSNGRFLKRALHPTIVGDLLLREDRRTLRAERT